MWAHDKVGTFAQMGILSPITDVLTEDDLADFLPDVYKRQGNDNAGGSDDQQCQY